MTGAGGWRPGEPEFDTADLLSTAPGGRGVLSVMGRRHHAHGAAHPVQEVGVVLVTQTPEDVPAEVLAQLGNRVQHALRVFTPRTPAR